MAFADGDMLGGGDGGDGRTAFQRGVEANMLPLPWLSGASLVVSQAVAAAVATVAATAPVAAATTELAAAAAAAVL